VTQSGTIAKFAARRRFRFEQLCRCHHHFVICRTQNRQQNYLQIQTHSLLVLAAKASLVMGGEDSECSDACLPVKVFSTINAIIHRLSIKRPFLSYIIFSDYITSRWFSNLSVKPTGSRLQYRPMVHYSQIKSNLKQGKEAAALLAQAYCFKKEPTFTFFVKASNLNQNYPGHQWLYPVPKLNIKLYKQNRFEFGVILHIVIYWLNDGRLVKSWKWGE